MKSIEVLYFGPLREERGCDRETVATNADTPLELYAQLREEHALTLDVQSMGVAVDEEFQKWETPLNDRSTVAFIPPVAGG